ncbi:MAG: hypothetical protein Kow0088_19720 [Anaerolineales bacterium]
MEQFLQSIAMRFWPELKSYNEARRMIGTGEVISFLYTLPLALGGVLWLIFHTDLNLIAQEWQLFLVMGGLLYVFTRLDYFIIVEIRPERYGSAKGSLAGMTQWTAAFLLGPTALWLSILFESVRYLFNMRLNRSPGIRWDMARNLTHDLANYSLAYMVALAVYQRIGGRLPLNDLDPASILRGMAALGVHLLVFLLIWAVYLFFGFWTQYHLAGKQGMRALFFFLVLALGLPNLAHPFAIQAAAIYSQHGWMAFLFFNSGLFLLALLARQLSWAAESSRQRTRQLEMLESLSRAIINSPPDASNLATLLEEHAPAMLPSARLAIFLKPDQLMVKRPGDWDIDLQPVLAWCNQQKGSQVYLAKDPLPWQDSLQEHDPVILTPILDIEKGEPIGCIYVELRSLAQPWDRKAVSGLLPGLKTLADQIASALHQAQVYNETLNYQRTLQELKFAGRIQSSLLPDEIPILPDWELAVTMLPARETSGDFFDFIPLGAGKIGLLIADVADKGIPAALYMALCRTLIRTYAIEYEEASPDVVFFAVNERLLKDARINLFVTAFYAILEPQTGLLTYCNAGHNPPYWFNRAGQRVIALSPTGMPLGIEEDQVWKLANIQIQAGDTLILYTDGIPDAHNQQGDFYREKRLVETAQAAIDLPAQDLLIRILDDVQNFVGEEAQFDDITLMILRRNFPDPADPP